MTMNKITVNELKKIAEQYGLTPIKIKGTETINISKKKSPRYIEIEWDEFEESLKKKGLAIYKATESDFIKIMKEKS